MFCKESIVERADSFLEVESKELASVKVIKCPSQLKSRKVFCIKRETELVIMCAFCSKMVICASVVSFRWMLWITVIKSNIYACRLFLKTFMKHNPFFGARWVLVQSSPEYSPLWNNPEPAVGGGSGRDWEEQKLGHKVVGHLNWQSWSADTQERREVAMFLQSVTTDLQTPCVLQSRLRAAKSTSYNGFPCLSF